MSDGEGSLMSDYLNEVLDIAARMSQELQEFVDVGEESGSEMRATKDLLEEWNEVYRRHEDNAQITLTEKGERYLANTLEELG